MQVNDIQLGPETKMGQIRQLAKEIKQDHGLALQLWQSGDLQKRLLAILILDKKALDTDTVTQMVKDMGQHSENQQIQLMDWLYANQLAKSKAGLAMIDSWRDSDLVLKRRTYWYQEGRLRWMGKAQPSNSADLLTIIEQTIQGEDPQVQWAMNFLAGWIGVYEKDLRDRCIALGQTTGLYRDQKVSPGCTPNYLPDFIRIEQAKRNLA